MFHRAKSEEGAESRHSPLATGLAIALAVLAIYILSPPFVITAVEHTPPEWEPTIASALQVTYQPLTWLYDNVPPARRFYNCYYDLIGVPH